MKIILIILAVFISCADIKMLRLFVVASLPVSCLDAGFLYVIIEW